MSSSSTPESLEQPLSTPKQQNGPCEAPCESWPAAPAISAAAGIAIPGGGGPQLRSVDDDLLRVPIAEAARRLGFSVKTLKRRGDDTKPTTRP